MKPLVGIQISVKQIIKQALELYSLVTLSLLTQQYLKEALRSTEVWYIA